MKRARQTQSQKQKKQRVPTQTKRKNPIAGYGCGCCFLEEFCFFFRKTVVKGFCFVAENVLFKLNKKKLRVPFFSFHFTPSTFFFNSSAAFLHLLLFGFPFLFLPPHLQSLLPVSYQSRQRSQLNE